ncbi:MAG: arsinothricin resistance N-acetyltransferase ArsN1 family B, partial [Hyphomicrobiaceae bacterium]
MMIRPARAIDAEAIAAIYDPIVRDTYISFEGTPPTADEMRSRIAATLADYPWLVADEGGRVAAYAYAGQHRSRDAYRWSCDVSVYVAETAQRRGHAVALYGGLLAILTRQGLANAYAGIALPNAASVALHERAGFEAVGVYRNVGFKNGSWRDVGWWGIALNALGPSPHEPTSFAELRKSVPTIDTPS